MRARRKKPSGARNPNEAFSIVLHGPSAKVSVRNGKVVRAVILSDLHFPFEDPSAMTLARAILEDADPHLIILNGDLVDFYGISSFPKDPLRQAQFAAELEKDKEKIHRLLSWAPDIPWIYLEGNHERRLLYHLWKRTPEFAGSPLLRIPSIFELPENVIYLSQVHEPRARHEFVAPQVQLSKLYIMHGDLIRGSRGAINIARSILLKLLQSVLVGHHHTIQSYTQSKHDGTISGAWVVGCLCFQRPHFDAGRIWAQGIAVVSAERRFFEPEVIPFIHKDKQLVAMWRGRRYACPANTRSW
ncbi:MAG: metallophosphoesterase [Anaerolineae bacterium]|nr:metallophosphoesterase [Anaerolineae bacterium]